MRRSAILVPVVCVLVIIIATMGCGGGGQQQLGAEEVARAYLRAYVAMDAEAVAENFSSDQRDEVKTGAEYAFAQIDRIAVSNLKTDLVSESENGATVQTNYDWEITMSGQTDSGHQREIIDLIKENNRWVVKTVTVIENTQNQDAGDEFKTDNEVAQLTTATFYSDLHGGWKDINGDDNPNDATSFDDNVWGRSKGETELGHYYPTAIAWYSKHILTCSATVFDQINPDNSMVLGAGGHAAIDAEIQSHAIWMGLLVNEEGVGTQINGSKDRDWVSPLAGETSLYQNQILDSAMTDNNYNGGTEPGGSYCWVVGKNGTVLGAYKGPDGYWYAGFNGNYP